MNALRLRAAAHTLVELLVALALASTMATLAVPAYRELAADVRRDDRVQELRSSLLMARAEALSRGVPAGVCASSDGASCAARAGWTDGWLVYAGTDASGADPRRLHAIGGATAVRVHGNRAAVEFQPTADAATTATFTVCDARGARAARALVVSRTGRIRVQRGGGLRCG